MKKKIIRLPFLKITFFYVPTPLSDTSIKLLRSLYDFSVSFTALHLTFILFIATPSRVSRTGSSGYKKGSFRVGGEGCVCSDDRDFSRDRKLKQ